MVRKISVNYSSVLRFAFVGLVSVWEMVEESILLWSQTEDWSRVLPGKIRFCWYFVTLSVTEQHSAVHRLTTVSSYSQLSTIQMWRRGENWNSIRSTDNLMTTLTVLPLSTLVRSSSLFSFHSEVLKGVGRYLFFLSFFYDTLKWRILPSL